jgi:hypothetical protein
MSKMKNILTGVLLGEFEREKISWFEPSTN